MSTMTLEQILASATMKTFESGATMMCLSPAAWQALIEHAEINQDAHLTSREAKVFDRSKETTRRQQVVETLLAIGWVWDEELGWDKQSAAQEAAKPVVEVDDAMIDRAMTAYDEFLGSDDEADYEAMRAALIAATQDGGEPKCVVCDGPNKWDPITGVCRMCMHGE